MHHLFSILLFINPWIFNFGKDTNRLRRDLLAENDTLKINSAVHLSEAVRFSNPTDYKNIIDIVKKVASKNIIEAQIIALSLEGEYIYDGGNKVKGYRLVDSAINLAHENKKYDIEALVNQTKGRLLNDDSQYSEAYKCLNAALKYQEKNIELPKIIGILTDIGNTQINIGNIPLAQKYYQRALDCQNKQFPDSQYLVINTIDVGLCYYKMGQIDKALEYYKKVDQICGNNPNLLSLKGTNSGNMGEIYILKNDITRALPLMKFDMQVSLATRNLDSYANVCKYLAKVFSERNQHDSAKFYINKAISIDATHSGLSVNNQLKRYLIRASVYANSGDFKTAYQDLNKYLVAYDTLIKKETREKIGALEYKFELESKDKELENNKLLLTEKAESLAIVTQQRSVLIILILVTFIVLYFAVVNARKKVKFARELVNKQDIIITQNQKLSNTNEKLNAVLKQKTDILSIVSHDLKGPINRVNGLFDLIQLDPKNEAQYREILKISILDANSLIQNLLYNAALEEGRSIIRPEEFDVVNAINNVVKGLTRTAEYKGIELLFETAVFELIIFHDKLSFTRILENLLSNAIKFSPKNTKVTVGIIVQEPDFFQFYVLDEGPGISVQDQAELFVAFQKGSSVATAGESSTGLGLSIVDKLTKLIQGTIQLESEPGKGAIFTVKLPIRLVNMESENDAEDLLLMN